MTLKRKISISDVRKSFKKNKSEGIIIGKIIRPVGELVTPIFYNSGLSANAVTYINGLTTLSLLMLLSVNFNRVEVILCLFYLRYILDVVDGNISRINDSSSYWGKFIDGWVDYLGLVLIPMAVGIGNYLAEGDPKITISLLIISNVSGFSHMTRSRYSFFREWMRANKIKELTKTSTLDRFEGILLGFLVSSTFFSLSLLYIFDLKIYLYFALSTQLLPEILVLMITLLRAGNTLKVYRKSASKND